MWVDNCYFLSHAWVCVICDVTLHNWMSGICHFEGNCHLHLKGFRVHIDTFLQNITNHLPSNAMSHFRWPKFLKTPLYKSQILQKQHSLTKFTTAIPRRWRQHVPPQCWYPPRRLYTVMMQKTITQCYTHTYLSRSVTLHKT